jgi:hypothetical protein
MKNLSIFFPHIHDDQYVHIYILINNYFKMQNLHLATTPHFFTSSSMNYEFYTT